MIHTDKNTKVLTYREERRIIMTVQNTETNVIKDEVLTTRKEPIDEKQAEAAMKELFGRDPGSIYG